MKPGKGAVFFISLLLLAGTILGSGCTDNGSVGGDSREVKPGDTVRVDYTGKLEDGTIFDTSREDVAKRAGIYVEGREYVPLTFVAGSGQVVEGFDEGVIGMKVEEEKTLTIPPEEAYGEYNESGVLSIPIEELNVTNRSELPQAGQTFTDMYGRPFKVTAVNDTYITIDTNHPLAGKTLIFDIKLISIE